MRVKLFVFYEKKAHQLLDFLEIRTNCCVFFLLFDFLSEFRTVFNFNCSISFTFKSLIALSNFLTSYEQTTLLFQAVSNFH